jgi:hypothetical protein
MFLCKQIQQGDINKNKSKNNFPDPLQSLEGMRDEMLGFRV